MNGSWHIYRPGELWKRRHIDMRILIRTEKIHAVAFTVPIAEFHTADSLRRRRVFNQLGPSVLAPEYDDAEILRRLRSSPNLTVGEALLTQSLFAGIGNVFKSEICFACNVNPFRSVATLSISELSCLASTARKFLLANVPESAGDQIVTYTGLRRTTGRTDREEISGFTSTAANRAAVVARPSNLANRASTRGRRSGARIVSRSYSRQPASFPNPLSRSSNNVHTSAKKG